MVRVVIIEWCYHWLGNIGSWLMLGGWLVLWSWMMCGSSGVVVVCCGWVGWLGWYKVLPTVHGCSAALHHLVLFNVWVVELGTCVLVLCACIVLMLLWFSELVGWFGWGGGGCGLTKFAVSC